MIFSDKKLRSTTYTIILSFSSANGEQQLKNKHREAVISLPGAN
jgi:hypothetical protein